MFQLLKNCQVLPFFYLCCILVGCDDVDHVSGTEGENCRVIFRLKNIKTLKDYNQVYAYQDGTKIHTFTNNNNSCYSYANHSQSTICMSNKSQSNITLLFTNLIQSGVYYLALLNDFDSIEESNKVNLTVYPAQYTTNSTGTAPSISNTSLRREQSKSKSGILMVASVLAVSVVLGVVLLGAFYWNYWRYRTTDKTPAENSTSTPQVIPDCTSVEYCVLEFPNQAGQKVRSTEDRVEYSPIVFPSKKIPTQNMEMKLPTQKNEIKVTTVHCKGRAKDKVSEKENTLKTSSKKSNQVKSNKAKKRRA